MRWRRRSSRRAGRALAIQADVTDPDQARALVADTVEHLGRLDTVINNAGVMLLGPVEDAPVEEWDRMIALNLQGLLYVAHAALPHLLAAAEDPPRRVADVVTALSEELPDLTLNMHFHDTRGTGLANVVTALDLGIDYFDASVGGMGGSPYAAGATGNVATEDLVHMLADMEIETGVDLEVLLGAARLAQGFIQGELPSKVLKAGPRWAVAGRV